MSAELQIKWIEPDITVYAIVHNAAGEAWNGSTFEPFTDANIGNYDVVLVEAGTASRLYVGDMPAGAASAAASITYHKQAGGSPTVVDLLIGVQDYRPNAATVATIQSDLASQASVDDLPTNAEAQAMFDALNQSASRRIVIATTAQFERPESGSVTYNIQVRTYDADGAAVDADSTPTLTATGIVSGSLAANLSAATNTATGVYRWTYTVPSNHAIEQIQFDASATIDSDTFTISTFSQVADFVAATFTTTDRANLEAALADTNELQTDWANGGRLDSILDTAAADALLARKLIEADKYVIKSGTPWQIAWMEKGTGAPGSGTELLRQDLFDVDGTDLTDVTTPVGRTVEA